MTPAEEKARRDSWRRQMRAHAFTWRSEIQAAMEHGFTLRAVPEGEWKHTDRYRELRRIVNGSKRHLGGSEALQSAIRCRNRSLGRPAFAS
jgi:hypothetical protein